MGKLRCRVFFLNYNHTSNKVSKFLFVCQGRRWSDGLHQAVEAKEGLPIQNETVTLASISYQNFFLQVWTIALLQFVQNLARIISSLWPMFFMQYDSSQSFVE